MRTINDIIPPSRRRESDSFTNESEPRIQRAAPRNTSRFPFKTLATVLLIVAAAFGVLYYFANAKVEITPTTVSAAVQSSLTAAVSDGTLPYEIITAEKLASQSVQSTGTSAVTSSASGTITIYNTQAKAQKLITNTRFATTAGLIFRIHAPVTIPGGTAAKPGSVTATVYADAPGDSYNVGPTSFTIPGFAGTPQATQVYARSTSAMAGGASGNVPVVDAATESSTRAALVTALGPELEAELQSKIPSGYTLLPGAATTTYQNLATTPSPTTGMAEIQEQGTITAVVFPNTALARAVAESVSGLDYQGEPLMLQPTSDLKLSATSLPTADATSFTFTLAGTASLAYTVDPAHIAAAVAGKTRSEAEVALTNYPEVKRALIILRPFWRQTFPQDPSKITVVSNNP